MANIEASITRKKNMKVSNSPGFYLWFLLVLILPRLWGCQLYVEPSQGSSGQTPAGVEADELSAAEILRQIDKHGADVSFGKFNHSLDESVVRIQSENGSGSGFFLTHNLIGTNAHVVADDSSVLISFSQGGEYTVPVVWVDDDLDFAVLQSSVKGVPLPLDQSPLAVGEDVIAVGFPQGRQVIAQSTGTVQDVLGCCLVHDALIAGGSSGGPLLDADSNVVGINTELAKVKGDVKNVFDRAVALKIGYILEVLRQIRQQGQ